MIKFLGWNRGNSDIKKEHILAKEITDLEKQKEEVDETITRIHQNLSGNENISLTGIPSQYSDSPPREFIEQHLEEITSIIQLNERETQLAHNLLKDLSDLIELENISILHDLDKPLTLIHKFIEACKRYEKKFGSKISNPRFKQFVEAFEKRYLEIIDELEKNLEAEFEEHLRDQGIITEQLDQREHFKGELHQKAQELETNLSEMLTKFKETNEYVRLAMEFIPPLMEFLELMKIRIRNSTELIFIANNNINRIQYELDGVKDDLQNIKNLVDSINTESEGIPRIIQRTVDDAIEHKTTVETEANRFQERSTRERFRLLKHLRNNRVVYSSIGALGSLLLVGTLATNGSNDKTPGTITKQLEIPAHEETALPSPPKQRIETDLSSQEQPPQSQQEIQQISEGTLETREISKSQAHSIMRKSHSGNSADMFKGKILKVRGAKLPSVNSNPTRKSHVAFHGTGYENASDKSADKSGFETLFKSADAAFLITKQGLIFQFFEADLGQGALGWKANDNTFGMYEDQTINDSTIGIELVLEATRHNGNGHVTGVEDPNDAQIKASRILLEHLMLVRSSTIQIQDAFSSADPVRDPNSGQFINNVHVDDFTDRVRSQIGMLSKSEAQILFQRKISQTFESITSSNVGR